MFNKKKRKLNRKLKTNSLTIAFAVTAAGENVSAGDYFTALELGESLKKLGYNIKFLSRFGENDWYDVSEDIDIVLTLLEHYDITKIKSNNNALITIAWPRNAFDWWVSKKYLKDFDIILSSSKTGQEFIRKKNRIMLNTISNSHQS